MRAAAVHPFAWIAPGLVALSLALASASCSRRITAEAILANYNPTNSFASLGVRYPLEGAVFPPEIVPCTFSWAEQSAKPDAWLLLLAFEGETNRLEFVVDRPVWTPDNAVWETIKRRSREKPAQMTILGFQQSSPPKILSRGQVSFRSSKDPVAAPIFYREVNLPFLEAVKDPSRIRWRFGTIDTPAPPPVVLEKLPVCGNCHSFSSDGQTLGMDVDYANNKGSYVITRVEKQMALASSDIITWDDYHKEERLTTYGLLSQVSPDGQTVISTVKDRSVFVAKPDLAFSQLFFPIKGILAVYHRQSKTFESLPGADDPQYVQSNPVWSPDGKEIVFARTKAYELRSKAAGTKVLLSEEDCAEFLREGKPFQFDLYRIRYNHGKGGKAEPIPGASANGRSNYFPKYSPDGKWIVFCQARSYMLLQPDSELYIIPAEGSTPRRLRCNTARMNSWHSFSPNGRWLVFSSKVNGPYTQLFLTHMDENGESTPPVALSWFTAPDRAANIPEFVNTQPGAIVRIQQQFLDDNSHARAGYAFETSGDVEHAIAEYEKALEINPRNVHAHQRLGFLLYNMRHDFKAGLEHTAEALRLDPADGCAHFDMGMALLYEHQVDAAISHLSEALRLMPEGFDRRYTPAAMNFALGRALTRKGDAPAAAKVLNKVLVLEPKNARAHYLLALAQAAQGMVDEPLQQLSVAKSLQPEVDDSPELHFLLSVNCEKAGRFNEALQSAQRALDLAPASTDPDILNALRDRVEACQPLAK